MKKIVLFLSIFFLTGLVVNAQEMMMCTMQYAPVCAEKQVQCIKAPCNPIKQTYGNSCQANADNAKTIYNGECLDAKIETKINNSLDNYFSKISQENLQTAKDKLNTKIDLLMQKSRLTSFASQVLNYIKYYLNK